MTPIEWKLSAWAVTYGICLAIRVAYAQMLVVFFLEELLITCVRKKLISKPYKIKGNNSLVNIKITECIGELEVVLSPWLRRLSFYHGQIGCLE